MFPVWRSAPWLPSVATSVMREPSPSFPIVAPGLELVDEQRREGLADRGVALEAGRGRVGEVVCNDILSDLIREHP